MRGASVVGKKFPSWGRSLGCRYRRQRWSTGYLLTPWITTIRNCRLRREPSTACSPIRRHRCSMPPSPMGGRAQISGAELLLAYIVGVEVECRIADAINPRHYQSGFHSTATIGGLGAAMAVGKILQLKEKTLLHTLGIAASMASGLAGKFRHYDQAPARRTGGGKRRHRGAARSGWPHARRLIFSKRAAVFLTPWPAASMKAKSAVV